MMGEKTGAGFPGNVCSILFDWEDGVIRATKSLDIVALIDGDRLAFSQDLQRSIMDSSNRYL